MSDGVIINLGERYAAAFGLLATAGKPDKAHIDKDYKLTFFDESDASVADVSMQFDGKEIAFGQIPFIASGDNRQKKLFAPPPLVSFNRQQHHIETPINGSDAVVVERWGMKSWDIRINGLLIDVENRQYPSEYIRNLNRLFSYKGVVDVSGSQFEDKDIDSIYFKSISIQPIPGYADTVKFSLTARSINAVGFTLLNPNG